LNISNLKIQETSIICSWSINCVSSCKYCKENIFYT